MPKTYHKPLAADLAIVRKVLAECHPDLVEVEARVGLVFVAAAHHEETGEPLGPAISERGAAVAARIRLTSAKQRVHLPYDAMIEIDKDRWDDLDDDSREALVDHELTHLVVVRDSDGVIVTGDDLRPKLRTRPDDWVMSGFAEVVQRRGQAALEYQSMDKLVSRPGYRQLLFPWMTDVVAAVAAGVGA